VAVILYIDTDQIYMSSLKLLLEEHGYKVLLACTREHMRQVLLDHVVDLALVDQDFAGKCARLLAEVRSVSPLTRTMLLGMRATEPLSDVADAYFARLDGPKRLLAAVEAVIAPAMHKTAHQT
jgi:response regulator RpfG family c-di-GMP phosphodiesterase